jgi:hypothetical protein
MFLYSDSQHGNQPWVQTISDNGGSDEGGVGGGPSLGGVLNFATQAATLAAALSGSRMGPVVGSGGGATDCPVGCHLFGAYGQRMVSQPNAQGSGAAHPGPGQSTITGD